MAMTALIRCLRDTGAALSIYVEVSQTVAGKAWFNFPYELLKNDVTFSVSENPSSKSISLHSATAFSKASEFAFSDSH
jgi:hypothetical protein